MQAHGIVILSRELSAAKNEGRQKGLEIRKRKLGIITTLEVAGELSRWTTRKPCRQPGHRQLGGYFLVPVVRRYGVFRAEVGNRRRPAS
jgi:hypothetical protein